MKHIFFLALVFLSLVSQGQVLFNKTFAKPQYDYLDAVIERKDGKYLTVGSSRSRFGNDYDVSAVLVDSAGNLLWDRYIGQSNRLEFAHSLVQTRDSNFLVVGQSNSSVYLMKFDSSATMIWEKEYLSPNWAEGFSVGETNDSSYFFISRDPFTRLFKTNLTGDTLWTKRYPFTNSEKVISTADGGFALTGQTNSTGIDKSIQLIKTDTNGDTLWTKQFGGPGGDLAGAVQQLSDGGYLLAGSYDPLIADAAFPTYLIRTDASGDTLWTRKHNLGYPNHLQECRFGNGYILSATDHQTGDIMNPDKYYLWISKLSTTGNIEWVQRFDGYTYKFSNNLTQTSDGGFLLTGYVNSPTGIADGILIKLDSAGNFVLSLPKGNITDAQPAMTIFPNPAAQEVTVLLAGNQLGKELEIINSLGITVKKLTLSSGTELKFAVSDLAAGVYLLRVNTGESSISGKLQIR